MKGYSLDLLTQIHCNTGSIPTVLIGVLFELSQCLALKRIN